MVWSTFAQDPWFPLVPLTCSFSFGVSTLSNHLAQPPWYLSTPRRHKPCHPRHAYYEASPSSVSRSPQTPHKRYAQQRKNQPTCDTLTQPHTNNRKGCCCQTSQRRRAPSRCQRRYRRSRGWRRWRRIHSCRSNPTSELSGSQHRRFGLLCIAQGGR